MWRYRNKSVGNEIFRWFSRIRHSKEVGPSAGWKPHESIRQSKKILKEFIDSKLEYGVFLEDTLIGIIGIYEDDYLFEQPEFEEKQALKSDIVWTKIIGIVELWRRLLRVLPIIC